MGDPLTVRDGVCNLPESSPIMLNHSISDDPPPRTTRKGGRDGLDICSASRGGSSGSSGSSRTLRLRNAVRDRGSPSSRSERVTP